jgi:hypothetical protein
MSGSGHFCPKAPPCPPGFGAQTSRAFVPTQVVFARAGLLNLVPNETAVPMSEIGHSAETADRLADASQW